MIFRFLNFVPLLGALLLAACGPASRTDALLNEVETYLNEHPDSARAVLAAVDTTDLLTRRLRARYSLLNTMVVAKSYEDITRPGLLDDAAWYEKHGTPDERLKLWFYRGQILGRQGDVDGAAVAFSRAEAYTDRAQDQHFVGLLYLAIQNIYDCVYNRAKEQEYSEKANELFRRTNDPYYYYTLGMLARVYHKQKKWDLADSLYRQALPYFEMLPELTPDYLSDYATMKVLQPERDPAGAIALLDRYQELKGAWGVKEAGTYAYALVLTGGDAAAAPIIAQLRAISGYDRQAALVWLARIDVARRDFESAFWEQAEAYENESDYIPQILEDSVTQALRKDAAQQAEDAKESRQKIITIAGGIFFALLSVILLLLLRRSKAEVERKRLIDLREQMQEELERVHAENALQAEQISGQEDRIREMEASVARERETYTRERVNRLRQLGELRSTFWWRERGGMRESDAIQRIKKEIAYVYQTDNDGAALIRRLDGELDGAVSELRKKLHLRGKPKEVLFLCCCILDLEPEMIAEIMDTSKANVYQKRSRLRVHVRELNDPLLSVLIEK